MSGRVLLVLSVFFLGAPVFGQPFGRTFVSAQVGSDANPCLPTAPCRTFARALVQTQSGGEIVVLDSGGYGSSLTIAKAIQINAPPGVYAGMTGASGTVLTVAAGASDSVLLRGLSLNSTGASVGIDFSAGQSLHIENALVSNFAINGIQHSVNGGTLYLSNSTLRKNNYGLFVGVASGSGSAAIRETSFLNNATGAYAAALAVISVYDSVAYGNSTGFLTGGADSSMNVEHCAAVSNGNGVAADHPDSIVRVSNSVVSNNSGFGLAQIAGILESRLNNTVRGNGSGNTSGMITTISGQ